jgi:hypothetical protein
MLRREAVNNSLSVYDFGRQLLETNDLDPVYVMLWNSPLESRKVLRSWLLSYWCFYHSGTASWVIDQPDYWTAMMAAASSKDYPRCPERRHFRGANAIKSVTYLQWRGVFNLFRDVIASPSGVSAKMAAVQKWVGFGPWIAFKVVDMLERLDLCEVKFTVDATLYDSPREAAAILYEQEKGIKDVHGESGPWALDQIVRRFSDMGAPPRNERPVGYQEAETILCKWKSYLNGHYKVGEDIESLRKSLTRFPESRTAGQLLAAGVKGGLWCRK